MNAGNGPGHLLTGLPTQLPSLTTQELEQLMDLQRALSIEWSNENPQLPLHLLRSLSMGGEVSFVSYSTLNTQLLS